jgi:hypothetical protein
MLVLLLAGTVFMGVGMVRIIQMPFETLDSGDFLFIIFSCFMTATVLNNYGQNSQVQKPLFKS